MYTDVKTNNKYATLDRYFLGPTLGEGTYAK